MSNSFLLGTLLVTFLLLWHNTRTNRNWRRESSFRHMIPQGLESTVIRWSNVIHIFHAKNIDNNKYKMQKENMSGWPLIIFFCSDNKDLAPFHWIFYLHFCFHNFPTQSTSRWEKRKKKIKPMSVLSLYKFQVSLLFCSTLLSPFEKIHVISLLTIRLIWYLEEKCDDLLVFCLSRTAKY